MLDDPHADPPPFAPQAPDRPWLFGLLVAPGAVVANGIIQGGALTFLLTQGGMGVDEAARWIFLLALPTMLYFLYSPITDFFVRRRTWILLASFASALCMLAAFRYGNLTGAAPLRLILLSGCLAQLIIAAIGGLMGELHGDKSKQIASSFYQCGSMAFGAVAAWLLIRESSRLSVPTLGWISAAIIAIPSLFAFLAPGNVTHNERSAAVTLRTVLAECRSTFARWDALLYVIIITVPICSGGAVGLLPGIARNYGVQGDQVAWINGLLGAVVIAAGSLATTVIPTSRGAVRPFLLIALVNAGTLLVFVLLPMTPATYYTGTLLYLFTVGTCYTCSTAVILEFMGASGKSGSGRYSVINGIGNLPVLTVIWMDGLGAAHWGARGVPATEAALEILFSIPLLIYITVRPLHRKPVAPKNLIANS